MTEPAIVCDNLVKIYQVADLETVALQGLDLVVGQGELLGMVGASGSGKSTLMNILGGLDRPSAGRVWVNGSDLLKLSDAELNVYRRTRVGFVWQQGARNLIPYLNAQENVELPVLLAGQGGAAVRQWAGELLDMVGLAERRQHRLSELSGGEQQRVAIAVALANRPQLLLADEPTGEVDSETALRIYGIFQTLNRELKLTTVIVSHDPGIARHVDRVVAIRDGRLAAETVRQARRSFADDAHTDGHHEDAFEELTVLDAAGRLQIPKEYLTQLGIRGRVQLELVEGGVLVKPAPNADYAEEAESLASHLAHTRRARGLRGLLQRLREH
jgi:ABC-type lipoprotein export system ATPase subunit/bifunctional DNA-binding transcriptional regulator/antitoxin component of YhaV-PrlF toxin-antitoxin module